MARRGERWEIVLLRGMEAVMFSLCFGLVWCYASGCVGCTELGPWKV